MKPKQVDDHDEAGGSPAFFEKVMAVREEDQFVVHEIKPTWFDMRVVLEDKCVCLYGKDKNEPSHWSTPENPDYDELVLAGCMYEQSRDDRSMPQIIGIGTDNYRQKRYLIIDRREKF